MAVKLDPYTKEILRLVIECGLLGCFLNDAPNARLILCGLKAAGYNGPEIVVLDAMCALTENEVSRAVDLLLPAMADDETARLLLATALSASGRAFEAEAQIEMVQSQEPAVVALVSSLRQHGRSFHPGVVR